MQKYKALYEQTMKMLVAYQDEIVPGLRKRIDELKRNHVEVVHGYWIEHKWAEEENGLLVSNYECSVCHSWERDEGYYCPNCGAKMDGGNEDG